MRAALALGLTALLATGCSGSPAPRAAGPSPTPSTTAPSAAAAAAAPSCPAGGGDRAWPAGVPADLPVPPTAELGPAEQSPGGLTLVRFTTSQSVRDGVVFLSRALQPAGFTLGRGDAEALEADVPFSRGPLRGLLKMIADQPCRTQWVLALQTGPGPSAGAPLLQPVTTASPSPLPFG